MKKLSSLFLIVLLLNLQWGGTAVYGATNSEADFVTSPNATGVTITKYKGTTKDVIIPDTIKGQTVTSIGYSAFASKELKSVTIPASVTNIQNHAFDSNQLKSVTIPAGITNIGIRAFSNNKLEHLTIPSGLNNIESSAFASNELKSVTIPTSVTSIDHSAFRYNKLESVIIPNSVTNIGPYAFEYNKLTNVTIPSGVTIISDSVFASNKLESVTIPSGMINIGFAAFQYNKLESVTIPDTVTNITATAFAHNQLTNVTIPLDVISIGDAAFAYNQLNHIEFKGQILNLNKTAFYKQGKQGDTFHGWFEDKLYTNKWTETVETSMTIYSKWNPYSIGTVILPKTGQLIVDDKQNFELIENLSDGTTQNQTANTVFTVSNPSVATMQGNTLTAIAPGTVTVKATYGSSSDTATITVNEAPVKTTGMVLSPKTGQLIVGEAQTFDLVENLSDETKQNQTANAVFTVSDPSVATMQGNTLTAIAPGTVTVKATYGSSSDTATITVVNRVMPPVPQPTPQPVVPLPEPLPTPSPPSDQISIQRVIENGVVSYRGYVTLENVQAIIQQLTNGEERVVRVRFPAEAATVETTLDVQRAAGAFLAEQEVDLLIELANGKIRIPHTSLNDFTEALYFRIVPVPSAAQEPIEENAQQNEHVQTFVGNRMTVNLLGQPVTIETNLQNQPVTMTLPIPTDVTKEQLQTLFVYIEHSDGTTEVKQGRIVEMAPGVQGFVFDVTHFSTFALMYATEQEEVTEEKLVVPYIKGYPDGTFKPNAAVTRAQMTTMLARFLTNGKIPTAQATFEDTEKNTSKDTIEFVKQAGLFNGTTQTKFDPNGTITRAQMAGVIARWVDTVCAQEDTKAYCQTAKPGKVFSDVAASHWAASSIERVSALGIMTGNSATTFNPNGALTRAQAVKVLNQLFERPAVENITESTFRDVPASHWAIGDIEAAATEMTMKK